MQGTIERNGLGDIIVLHDWTDNVEEAVRSVHCIVRPDPTGSPWGRDIIEAMSMGRPVIAAGTEEIDHGLHRDVEAAASHGPIEKGTVDQPRQFRRTVAQSPGAVQLAYRRPAVVAAENLFQPGGFREGPLKGFGRLHGGSAGQGHVDEGPEHHPRLARDVGPRRPRQAQPEPGPGHARHAQKGPSRHGAHASSLAAASRTGALSSGVASACFPASARLTRQITRRALRLHEAAQASSHSGP